MTQMIGFGQKSGDCAASFRCAACGEVAAVVKAAPAGAAIDMGPPLGPQTHRHPGIVVDAFGGTAWKLAGGSHYAAVRPWPAPALILLSCGVSAGSWPRSSALTAARTTAGLTGVPASTSTKFSSTAPWVSALPGMST